MTITKEQNCDGAMEKMEEMEKIKINSYRLTRKQGGRVIIVGRVPKHLRSLVWGCPAKRVPKKSDDKGNDRG